MNGSAEPPAAAPIHACLLVCQEGDAVQVSLCWRPAGPAAQQLSVRQSVDDAHLQAGTGESAGRASSQVLPLAEALLTDTSR